MRHYVSPTNGFGHSYGYYPRPGTGFGLGGLRGGFWGSNSGDSALRGALLGGGVGVLWWYLGGGKKATKTTVFNIATVLPVMGAAAGVLWGIQDLKG